MTSLPNGWKLASFWRPGHRAATVEPLAPFPAGHGSRSASAWPIRRGRTVSPMRSLTFHGGPGSEAEDTAGREQSTRASTRLLQKATTNRYGSPGRRGVHAMKQLRDVTTLDCGHPAEIGSGIDEEYGRSPAFTGRARFAAGGDVVLRKPRARIFCLKLRGNVVKS